MRLGPRSSGPANLAVFFCTGQGGCLGRPETCTDPGVELRVAICGVSGWPRASAPAELDTLLVLSAWADLAGGRYPRDCGYLEVARWSVPSASGNGARCAIAEKDRVGPVASGALGRG